MADKQIAQKARKKKSPLLRAAAVIALLILFVGVAGLIFAASEIKGSGKESTAIRLEISPGASTAEIAQCLKDSGVIRSSLLFRIYSRQNDADGSYHYGSFTVDPSSGYAGVIHALQQVQSFRETITVTIPEGYNAYQIADLLEESQVILHASEFLSAANTHEFDISFWNQIPSNEDGLHTVRLDGYLFPDTYSFYPFEDPDTVILTMLQNFEEKVLTDEITAKMKASDYTLPELLSLAAIVQMESSTAEEMTRVASVFVNRLQPGSGFDCLQSDTTNAYINRYLKPNTTYVTPSGDISQEQIDFYDSYATPGIPGGIIANPGLDAILAVLSPADTPYYFFVTDCEWNYYYGITMADHERNIAKAIAVNKAHGINGLL